MYQWPSWILRHYKLEYKTISSSLNKWTNLKLAINIYWPSQMEGLRAPLDSLDFIYQSPIFVRLIEFLKAYLSRHLRLMGFPSGSIYDVLEYSSSIYSNRALALVRWKCSRGHLRINVTSFSMKWYSRLFCGRKWNWIENFVFFVQM